MTDLPFCTVALLPSISRRYSPAWRSALPTLAAWVMLMVLLMGLAKTGRARAVTAKSAAIRRSELDFMRVNFLSMFESAAPQLPRPDRMLDTHDGARAAFPEPHRLFPD